MASATLQDTRVHPATSPTIAAALAFEDATLRNRMRREARAAATLETAVCGYDLATLPTLAIEDAVEAGEQELAAEPIDNRAIALERALAALRALLDDDDTMALAA